MAERVSLVNSVVSNLLTNAIKFSNRGSSIEIDAHAETDEVILRIQDHGIGMPESLQKNLFNLKVPTGRQGTNGEPGTGFGMPLVDKFVKGYGGSMRIHSVDINDSPDESGTRIELTFQRPQTG
jgi:signal transduction histidine kinase